MFDAAVCINLDEREERWIRFRGRMKDLFLPTVKRLRAIDSTLAKPPRWFAEVCPHPGAWGCLRSHTNIWEAALCDGVESLLVFEDDAIFYEGFDVKFRQFMDAVPGDWDQLYFGGQHLYLTDDQIERGQKGSLPPIVVNEHVLRCQNVNRTHAYAMRPRMMQAALDHCSLLPQGLPFPSAYHVDHRMGELHADYKVYAPREWIVGQEAGESDVRGNGKQYKEKWWNNFEVREAEVPEAVA